jgi:hypothetical protein
MNVAGKSIDELHHEKIENYDNINNLILKKQQELLSLENKINDNCEEIEEIDEIDESDESDSFNEDLENNIENNINNQIKELKHEINNLLKFNNELDYFEKIEDVIIDYYNCEKNNFKNSNFVNQFDISNEYHDDIIDIIDINREIKDISKNIINTIIDISQNIIKNKLDEDDLLSTLDKLNESIHKNLKIKKPVKKKINDKIKNNVSILDILTTNDSDSDINLNNKDNKDIKDSKDIKMDKGTLRDIYLSLTDPNFICNKNKSNNSLKLCPQCNKPQTLIQAEGLYVCIDCGICKDILIESEIPSHKDSINDKPKYPYKPINHLIERINQFQAKQTTIIPDEIYKIIDKEVNKLMLINSDITVNIILKILKKYRLSTYYEHHFLIYSQYTKTPPPTLNRDDEDLLKQLFRQIEKPFKKYKPANRSNSLNFSYVLHKLCLIMEELYNKPYMKDNSKYFPLLKSRSKLKLQDSIWKPICLDNNWPFHSSF